MQSFFDEKLALAYSFAPVSTVTLMTPSPSGVVNNDSPKAAQEASFP
jgi:hypothetical protein